MQAAIFVEPGRIVLEDKPIPQVGPRDVLLRVTTTTICGTDVHILRGEYPVARGLTVGHEPVGLVIIDHKSAPIRREYCAEKAATFVAQLDAYREMIEVAGFAVDSVWIHFPLAGVVATNT